MVYFIKIRDNMVSILNDVFLFKYVYVILAFISFIPVTRIYLGFLTKLILLWGAYLIVNRLAIKRDFNRKSSILILCLLIVSYCVTIILNFRNDFARNVLNICYLCVNLLVVYGLDEKKSPKELINDFRQINLLLIILSGVMSIISVFMFIFLVKYKLTVDGLHVNQGFVYNRLYGIYSSANAAGMLAVISVAITVINLFLNRPSYNKKFRMIYITNIVVQTIYIVLSDSRGAQVGAVCIFAVGMILFFRQKIINNKVYIINHRVNALKFIISILLCAVVSLAGIAVIAPAKKVFSYIPDLTSNFVPTIKQRMQLKDDHLIPHENIASLITKGAYYKSAILELQNKNKNTKTASNSSSPTSKQSSSNQSSANSGSFEVGRDSYEVTGNRLTIWRAQFKVWEKSPIFGVANSSMSDNKQRFDNIKTLTKGDRSELLRSNGNSHNGYLQLLVMGGAIPFLLFALFWIILIKKALKRFLFHRLGEQHILSVILTFAIVVSLLVNNIFESHIILRNADFIGVITWVYTGYLFCFLNSLKKSTQKEEMMS
jgi:hypothetical protein